MEEFLGTIKAFGFNFNPRGWAKCEGQLISIASNSALFSLLGTTYGGNGTTTFALPDLRGRMPIGQGQGPGLSNYVMGQLGGTENTTLIGNNLPSHSHTLNAYSEAGDVASPANALLATSGTLDPEYRASGTGVAMAPAAIGLTGGGQSFNNVQPYLVVNYCICVNGIFPSRN